MTRRLFAALLTSAVALSTLVPSSVLAAVTADKLFFIQRSKNANEVHYDARVESNGSLDPKDPVEVYWLNKASDGSRSPITLLQRAAYGFDVDANGNGTYRMKLRAFPERPITLERVNGHWRGETTIAGKRAYLERLYVATDDSGVMPKVLYVDVFGQDAGSGAPIQEHIVEH